MRYTLLIPLCFLLTILLCCDPKKSTGPDDTPAKKDSTKLYLRTDSEGLEYLSEDKTTTEDSPHTVEHYLYDYSIKDWKAVLNKGIETNKYTFSLWLRADALQGKFHVSLLISHTGIETELASTDIIVPKHDDFKKYTSEVNGKSGGIAGDMLILRMSYSEVSGGGRGELIHGCYVTDYDSHVIFPGDITVRKP